ncbi:plastocyanin/azurin family copper-binding protein [Haladaptatus sp. R4]|uniref:plastocyanin/azurin family copper-binding protein n=1 Tax=Haladaptatus sp. R4 TaxID=1679489 RepID=UPI0009EDDBC0|nr:plastocyanin/azurin family copper-binding protein [Haladaptatus sp. R4]
MTPSLSRRMLLKATGTTVVSATLAGCSSSQPEPDETPADTTVIVGANGNYRFDPENLTITAGTTVAWEWKSNRHNIVVNKQPKDANWEGTPGGKGKLYHDGYRYTHSFDVPGYYHYYCNPHRSIGMVGSVTVKESSKNGGTKTNETDGGSGKTTTGSKATTTSGETTTTTGNGN